jgi:hypothetical protein
LGCLSVNPFGAQPTNGFRIGHRNILEPSHQNMKAFDAILLTLLQEEDKTSCVTDNFRLLR